MFKSLTPTLSILIAIILFVFFAQPQYTEIQQLRQEVRDYQGTTQQYEALNAQLSDLLARKNSISAVDRERLDKMIPNTLDNPHTLVDLEAIARSQGMLLGNVSVSETLPQETDMSANDVPGEIQRPSDQLITSDISFELIGTYEQFKSFIREIERTLAIMEITSMSLVAATDNFQQYSVTVQTYALPQ